MSPVTALQAARGGGKSFLLDQLAELKEERIDTFCVPGPTTSEQERPFFEQMRHILKGSIAVCVDFYDYDACKQEADFGTVLALHLLHAYFFERKESFVHEIQKRTQRLPSIKDALDCIRHHAQKPILLCIDELYRSADCRAPADTCKITALREMLEEVCQYQDNHGPEEFNFVVSTLDTASILDLNSKYGRPVRWIPLPPLSINSSLELFHPLHDERVTTGKANNHSTMQLLKISGVCCTEIGLCKGEHQPQKYKSEYNPGASHTGIPLRFVFVLISPPTTPYSNRMYQIQSLHSRGRRYPSTTLRSVLVKVRN